MFYTRKSVDELVVHDLVYLFDRDEHAEVTGRRHAPTGAGIMLTLVFHDLVFHDDNANPTWLTYPLDTMFFVVDRSRMVGHGRNI